MSLTPPVTVSRSTIATGDAGVMQTLTAMRRLIDGGMDSPLVIQSARELAVQTGGNNQVQVAIGLRWWLARHWQFVSDPVTREHLEDAEYLLRQYQATGYVAGDCDEAAILGATLGMAVGIPATLTVLAFDLGDGGVPRFSHVYASLTPDNGPVVDLDVTKPNQPTAPPVRWLTVDA